MTSRAATITCVDCGQRGRHYGRGLCCACYQTRRRAGTLAARPATRRPPGQSCTICGQPAKSLGLCAAHYQQQRDMDRAAQAGRIFRPRTRTYAKPTEFTGHAPETKPCRQCHTTIRPPHSAGLCVDCVRAAGGLRHDPWEAA
jgi:hypothetical protein